MSRYHEILITGGTSGLGFMLVKEFLNRGYLVTATGRDPSKLHDGNIQFVFTDFGDLSQTAGAVNELCGTHQFDIIINNAGILSPPLLTRTKDNLEVTFQVNFLAHLMLNEIIIRSKQAERKLRIFCVTSPVYRIADRDLEIPGLTGHFNPLNAYSSSKLFLLLMNRHLSEKYRQNNVSCFGLNPGVFRSGIKRTQRQVFRSLYGIAAPFMKDPARIAYTFSEIIDDKSLTENLIYDSKQNTTTIPLVSKRALTEFWSYNYDLINPFIGES